LRRRGWEVLFDPLSRVVHSKGVCGRRKPLVVEWHKHRGMVRFFGKQGEWKFPAGALLRLGVWTRFVGVVLMSLFRRKKEAGVGRVCASTLQTSRDSGTGPITGVLGSSSFVGRVLLPILLSQGRSIRAISRRERISCRPDVVWSSVENLDGEIADWVSLCPLTALVDMLPRLAAQGARRLVAVSSTSRFTKLDSPDPRERRLAEDLAAAEEKILQWAAESKVEAVILRPTLVYDGVEDGNIAAISRFIRRWGWFPVCGPARGLRQPLRALDLARACAAALESSVRAGAFNLSGGATISYREMVERIFQWEGRRPRVVEVPGWLLRGILPVARFRGISLQVFERMNADLVFDHSAATEAFGFAPRGFEPPTEWEIPC
jgi:nucleoside-diphosphate-sugar epimerase